MDLLQLKASLQNPSHVSNEGTQQACIFQVSFFSLRIRVSGTHQVSRSCILERMQHSPGEVGCAQSEYHIERLAAASTPKAPTLLGPLLICQGCSCCQHLHKQVRAFMIACGTKYVQCTLFLSNPGQRHERPQDPAPKDGRGSQFLFNNAVLRLGSCIQLKRLPTCDGQGRMTAPK